MNAVGDSSKEKQNLLLSISCAAICWDPSSSGLAVNHANNYRVVKKREIEGGCIIVFSHLVIAM